jgi:hypothetical protein
MLYITQVINIIFSTLGTYIFNERHFRRKKWLEFSQRRLDEFYGPMLGLIKQVTENAKNTIKLWDSSDQAWREICKDHPHPFEDHDRYFEPFQKMLEDENERFRKEDIPALDKMLEIFKSKMHLAYPSTIKLFPQFSQYVDQFHRRLPYEVLKRLDLSGEPLAKLSADVEAHVDSLRHKLSGEKRVK